MPDLREALREQNPWWTGECKMEFKERDLHRQLQKFMPLPQMIALTGLRRVGKTTLMRKIASDFIEKGMEPRNVVYFSFDEFRETDIRDILREYENIMEKDVRKGKYLLLLDEIQKLSGWEDKIKVVYDTLHENVKIVISGSESLFIRRKSKETLAGRMFEFKVELLTFREFLSFRGVKTDPAGLYEKETEKLFWEFATSLGFPELVDTRDKDVIKKYAKEGIVDKVIFQDIPKLFKVKDVSVLKSLLDVITEEPGQLIDMTEVAKELKVSRQTLSDYLTYLEEAFLVRKLYNFSKSRRKVERKLRRYYPAIISVDLLFKEDPLFRSKAFECLIVNQLRAEFFWRDAYKNEVDAVMVNGDITPIEIKYGKIEYNGLLRFMQKFKVDKGFIISLNTEIEKKEGDKMISVVPAFKFFLKRD